jgi:hypothetical protein
MNLRNKILIAGFDALSDFAAEVRDALAANGREPAGDGQGVPCACGDVHDRRAAPDAPAVESRTWQAAFASDVNNGALIAVDGRYLSGEPGRRALRVTDKREGDLPGMFGRATDTITFLVVDLDTDRSDSLTVSPSAALDVAVEVPDTVPSDMTGGEA